MKDATLSGGTRHIRLDDIMEDIKYIWSGQEDLKDKHFMAVDVVVPAAAVADRPLGISSPIHTFQSNVMSYLHLWNL